MSCSNNIKKLLKTNEFEIILNILSLPCLNYEKKRRLSFHYLSVVMLSFQSDANNVFGVIIIVLRFCTICGKHVSRPNIT